MWFVKLIFQFSLGFTCTSDEDCNGHKCENGACHCGENWKIKPDCSGEWTCGKLNQKSNLYKYRISESGILQMCIGY